MSQQVDAKEAVPDELKDLEAIILVPREGAPSIDRVTILDALESVSEWCQANDGPSSKILRRLDEIHDWFTRRHNILDDEDRALWLLLSSLRVELAVREKNLVKATIVIGHRLVLGLQLGDASADFYSLDYLNPAEKSRERVSVELGKKVNFASVSFGDLTVLKSRLDSRAYDGPAFELLYKLVHVHFPNVFSRLPWLQTFNRNEHTESLKPEDVLRLTQSLVNVGNALRNVGEKNIADSIDVARFRMRRHFFKCFAGSFDFWFLDALYGYGRFVGNLVIGTIAIVLFFALVYYRTDSPYACIIYSNDSIRLNNPFDALYFSVVTMTTTGYGDIVTTSFWGRFCTAVQSILGFVVLGFYVNLAAQRLSD